MEKLCHQKWNQQTQRASHENTEVEKDAATAALQHGFARLFQQFDREKKAVEDERNYLLKAQFDHEQRVTALRASAESQGALVKSVTVNFKFCIRPNLSFVVVNSFFACLKSITS